MFVIHFTNWIIWCCHLDDQFVSFFSLLIRIGLTYTYSVFNCDGLHIIITLIYIITPQLTSTHKPVLARVPSSITNSSLIVGIKGIRIVVKPSGLIIFFWALCFSSARNRNDIRNGRNYAMVAPV